jgi:hypothetical protein
MFEALKSNIFYIFVLFFISDQNLMKLYRSLFYLGVTSILLGSTNLYAQTITIKKLVGWLATDTIRKIDNKENYIPYFFNETVRMNNIPPISFTVDLSGKPQNIDAQLINTVFQPLIAKELPFDTKIISATPNFNFSIAYKRKKAVAIITILPFRKNPSTGVIEKLVSFDVNISPLTFQQKKANVTRIYAANSILASGEWYKIGVVADGVQKIDYDFLKKAGIDLNMNPKNIRIYGNGGRMIPTDNSAPRYDDLAENSIQVVGEDDGRFNENDYILFYGQAPHRWELGGDNHFHHVLNLFSDTTFYYINADLGPGKRIQDQGSDPTPSTQTVNTFDDYSYHDIDKENFIKSGKVWYGETFDIKPTQSFSFDFPYIDASSNVYVKSYVGARSIGIASSFNVKINGQQLFSQSVNAVSQGIGANYGDLNVMDANVPLNSSTVNIEYTYIKPAPESQGWLNYCELNARRSLRFIGGQLPFRDLSSLGVNKISTFNIEGMSQSNLIWDVTNPTNVNNQLYSINSSTATFNTNTTLLKEFIVFNNSFFKPSFVEKVANQNLHSLGQYEMVIVAPDELRPEADRLASYHQNHDNLSVLVVSPKLIYNEFSSGKPEITGIRDFMKMLYDRAKDSTELPKYLLLFGDGSYDNKHRLSDNRNLIPTYQTEESLSPTSSYTSDDFFGCLDDNEGSLSIYDVIDLGIGRFPVNSLAEARGVVNKVINYSSNPDTQGDWRNAICFVADDDDGSIHLIQADGLSVQVKTSNPEFNIDKIYLDAYIKVSTPGGARYPDVTDAINKRVDKGALIINYTGHGGEAGWALERVLGVSDINSWTNFNKLPLFFTATCQFSRFDDPERTSAGELVLLNPNGGGIALFTTVREVYSGPNFYLNQKFYNVAFKTVNGKPKKLGDIMFQTKVSSNDENTRNFTLLGDPALTLSYPTLNAVTTAINNKPVTSTPDTAKALSKITITGQVTDNNGIFQSNYNGTVYPTIFDKATNVTSLGNDPSSPKETFSLQKNILYKGKASIINGVFTFSFIVPKDISYKYGNGKISYYFENGIVDGKGFYEKIIIGGTSNTIVNDVTGPTIKLYMNDEKFVFGGTTNNSPRIYALVNDSNGINTVGNGIGHDITAIIDNDNEHTIVLNDYYESNLNSYQSGKVQYPFKGLKDGRHSLRLKAWDVYNNSSEANTEFVVAESASLALYHVLNYPNPFTTHTAFYFEHNRPGVPLNILVQIFTITGKLVKSINTNMFTNGFRSDGIEWDGKDDYGDNIGRGVYIYRIKVKTPDSVINGNYEKLVILN